MNKLISSCKWYLLSTKNLPKIEHMKRYINSFTMIVYFVIKLHGNYLICSYKKKTI